MAQDSDDDILKELGLESDDEKAGASAKLSKALEESEEKRGKASKPKKARRSHSKAMDGFIVSDDESSSDEEPKKKRKRSVADNEKPDFAMPDVEVRFPLFALVCA